MPNIHNKTLAFIVRHGIAHSEHTIEFHPSWFCWLWFLFLLSILIGRVWCAFRLMEHNSHEFRIISAALFNICFFSLQMKFDLFGVEKSHVFFDVNSSVSVSWALFFHYIFLSFFSLSPVTLCKWNPKIKTKIISKLHFCCDVPTHKWDIARAIAQILIQFPKLKEVREEPTLKQYSICIK